MKFTGHERDLGSAGGAGDDLDYMHARYYNPLTGRFLTPDWLSGDRQAPQTWNRYSYALDGPTKFVDITGRDEVLSNLLINMAIAIADYFEGLDQGLRDRTGGGVTPSIPNDSERSSEYEAGRIIGGKTPAMDLVVEASVTIDTSAGPAATGGVSLVNYNDPYVFAGIGASQSLAPASMTFQIGLVFNYDGVGSYSGFFTSAAVAPIGPSVSGNPLNPDAPATLGIALSSDVGATETATLYVPLSAIPERIRQHGGVFFYEGNLLHLMPK